MLLLADRTNDATHQAVLFASDVFRAKSIAVYKVDAAMTAYDYTLHNVPSDFHRLYVQGMSRFDPLHVRRLSARNTLIGRFVVDRWLPNEPEDANYRAFFKEFNIADSIEMIFCHAGKIYAGMSVTWGDEDRRDDLPVRAIEGIRGYLEFNLRPAPADLSIERYGLTAREMDVVELLCCGRTNQDIGVILGIGLATVKTHLINLYTKLGVENRSAAVGLLSRKL